MSLTSDVKLEINKVKIEDFVHRKAELTTILRFAGGLHIIASNVVIEAELDLLEIAQRVKNTIKDLYGYSSELIILGEDSTKKKLRYLVRVVKNGALLARQIGLLDHKGRPVRGLPATVVNGTLAEARAAWIGAFLARGVLTEPGRSSGLEIVSPGAEAAMALVGVARRLGISAKAREVRSIDKVVIRDVEVISNLLIMMNALQTEKIWAEKRKNKEIRTNANRLANFDDANLRRSARAAVVAVARVKRAFELLKDEIPEHLVAAGKLRLKYPQASLEELGNLAEPPMTKDAMAGRIRRLLSMADKKANLNGVPDTESVINSDLLSQF